MTAIETRRVFWVFAAAALLLGMIAAAARAGQPCGVRHQVAAVQHVQHAQALTVVPFAIPVAVPVATINPGGVLYSYSPPPSNQAADFAAILEAIEAALQQPTTTQATPAAEGWQNRCIKCHGANNAGGLTDLTELSALSAVQRLNVIAEIRAGRMPKGGEQFNAAELDQVLADLTDH